MSEIGYIILWAYVIDIFIGDPYKMPHPVKGMGFVIKRLEPVFRRMVSNEKISGFLFSLFVVILSYMITFLIIFAAGAIDKNLALFVSVILMYTTISVKGLKTEAMKIHAALKAEDLQQARKNISMIVSRDTSNLDEEGIVRAAIESVAENTVDGIISPLLFAFIGGVPLAMAYKAVNTLDSMIGYKNDKYKNFGFFAAKLDDVCNFIPARISGVIMPLAGFLCGKSLWRSLRVVFADGHKNPSPNSGIPEAAMAGALGVCLGGGGIYNGKFVQKGWIGKELNSLNRKHIPECIEIIYVCSVIFLLIGVIIRRLIV